MRISDFLSLSCHPSSPSIGALPVCLLLLKPEVVWRLLTCCFVPAVGSRTEPIATPEIQFPDEIKIIRISRRSLRSGWELSLISAGGLK